MTAANFITLFGVVAVTFFGVIVLLDWLGRRKHRQTHHPGN
jgi:phosphatidylglycerophosphate synthase